MFCVAVAVATDTMNIQQKASAPHPPVSVPLSSSDTDRQRFESGTNAANSFPALSPDIAARNIDERLKAVDFDRCSSLSDVRSPEGLGAVMVEHVRCKTGLSHNKSQLAVATVLNLLMEQVPATEKLVAAILDDVQHQHVCVCV